MRILRCHIENFGKLQDQTFEFAEPVTWICQDNGWGKSTLAAFLRAMFYGLEGDRKRNIEENERKRWQPWQGGVFGGQLTFQTGERQYVISRIFRDKEANDEFELRDAITNRICSDYSCRIGEELFRINRDSFLRTIFISQNSLATAATEDIQAKIGRLTEGDSDAGQFEAASRYLTELLHELTPKRSTGRLFKLQSQITTLERKVREGSGIEDSIRQCEFLLKQEQENLHRCKKEEESLLQAQEQRIRQQEQMACLQEQQRKQAVWQELCDAAALREREFEEKGKPFPDAIPDLAELDQQIAKGHGLQLQKAQMEKHCIKEEEKQQWERLWQTFAQGTPPEAEIREMLAKERELSLLRRELSVEENTAAERQRILYKELENLEKMKEPEDEKGRDDPEASGIGFFQSVRAAFWPIGVFLMIVGAILLWRKGLLPGLFVSVGGLGICCVDSWFRSKKKRQAEEQAQIHIDRKRKAGQQSQQEEQKRKLLEQAEQEIAALQEELKQKKVKADELSTALSDYLERYALYGGEDSYRDLLFELKSQVSVFLRGMAEQSAYDRFLQEYQSTEKALEGYLMRYGFRPEREQLVPQLYGIRNALMEYEHAEKLYREALSCQDAYLAELGTERDRLITPAGDLKDLAVEKPAVDAAEIPPIQRLQEQTGQVRERIERIQKNIAGYREQLNSLQESMEEWSEQKTELEAKKEERERLSRKYQLLEQTKSLLTEAKEALTNRYAGPVYRQFCHYYEIISGEPAEAYRLDSNLAMTVEASGKQRVTGTLSAGYQDLIGLALRLALIDVMYQKEHPFLILDDPFTNLDDVKTRAGLRLLQQISEQYQMIYFTCTSARIG